MTPDLPPGATDEILQLIYKGQKLQACKRYKEMTGASLADSKRFIEELTAHHRQVSPDRFEKTSKTGCAAVVLVAFSIPAIAATACIWL